jgi:hypothetical protein
MRQQAKKYLTVALFAFSGLFAAPQVSAQGPFYAGGSVGQSDMDDNNAIPALITSGGYQLNPNFGLELAYVDLGKASYSGTFFGATVTGGSLKVTGLNFSAVGTFPVNPSFALFGKLGMFVSESKASDVTGGVPFSGTEDNTDVSFGLGVSYDITRNVSARAEWERFKAVGDIDLLSIGIAVKF